MIVGDLLALCADEERKIMDNEEEDGR